MEFELTPQLIAWGQAHGHSRQALEAHADWFRDYLANKTGKPYKDLNAAFRNCVRSDWGNIRRQMQFARKPVSRVPEGSISDARPGESMEDYLRRVAG